MALEREKIYECEVRRRRVKQGGGYESYWKVKTVAAALSDGDTEFRCKDCFGVVKVLGKNSKTGEAPYVEHKVALDSAYCVNGLIFRASIDRRAARLSPNPVE